MNKAITIRNTISLLFFGLFIANAQTGSIKRADKQYDSYAYFDAREIYEKVAKKGHKSPDLFQKLGDSYYFNAQLPEAKTWYAELMALNENIPNEYYYRYAQTLKSVGDYKEADKYMDKFAKLSGSDLRAKRHVETRNYLEEIKRNSGKYKIENAGINSSLMDFGSAIFDKQLVFASARDTGGVTSKKHSWTNQAFFSMYSAPINEDGSLGSVTKFSKQLTSRYNESTPCFSKDNSKVYFTRNNYLNGKKGANSARTTLLKVYSAENNNGVWSNIIELPFNSDEYSVAHPTLSVDEKYLYFVSDMPGSKGMSDLWKTEIKGNNTFGKPINISAVNTEGRETFPHMAEDGVLYFASDGHAGLGGLDNFAVKENEDGTFSKVINLGEPLNSQMDDFAYILSNNKSKTGFVTSNREGGIGFDDIYKTKEVSPIVFEMKHTIVGNVKDEGTGENIPGAIVTVYDKDMKEVAKVATDKDGNYKVPNLKADYAYNVRFEVEDSETQEKFIKTPNREGETDASAKVAKKVKKVGPGDDLAKAFNIKIIYFDLDKWFIRNDAAVDLAKIVEVMKQYPNMKIDVRSHTDCRQTAAYNEKLSDNRAKSTIAWMIKQGITADRLTGKGYGESQLVNDCPCEPTNESNCTDEQHQANRRSEFIIVSM